ncbi:MAG: CDP-alcohol phosphatidyltransferase family protein [Alphaproteobacteria bacterium]
MNLPNLISLARLLSVPAIVWLIIESHWLAAFALFAVAGLSDAVDGAIARRFGRQTTLGTYLDPLADKALLVAVYVTLAAVDRLASWLAILVLSRDVLIVGGILVAQLFAVRIEARPSMLSKLNTGLQIVLAAAVLAAIALQVELLADVVVWLIWAVAASTVASGIGYAMLWMHRMSHAEEAR